MLLLMIGQTITQHTHRSKNYVKFKVVLGSGRFSGQIADTHFTFPETLKVLKSRVHGL